MTSDAEQRIAAQLAKAMAVFSFRNSQLEAFHAGRVPISKTEDGSDVVVIDAEGNRIPWTEVSRLDDDEMRDLMREIVNRLYTFHLRIGDLEFRSEIERWAGATAAWDDPQLDKALPEPVIKKGTPPEGL